MYDELAYRLKIMEERVEAQEKRADNLFRREVRELPEEDFNASQITNCLYRLPKTLSSTFMSLLLLGEASASAIAKEKGRSRSLECSYLNQLSNMGYIQKTRRGRLTYFRLFGKIAEKRYINDKSK